MVIRIDDTPNGSLFFRADVEQSPRLPWEVSYYPGVVCEPKAIHDAGIGNGMVLLTTDKVVYRYDMALARQNALVSGRHLLPCTTDVETDGQKAYRVACLDRERLRRWVAGQWWLLRLSVTLLDDNGQPTETSTLLDHAVADHYTDTQSIARALAFFLAHSLPSPTSDCVNSAI